MKVHQVILNTDEYRSLITLDPVTIRNRIFSLDGEKRGDAWPEYVQLQFDNETKPIPDIISCGIGNMFLHRRSEQLLLPIISEQCELLPVQTDFINGFVVNVVGFSDCFDSEKAVLDIDSETGMAFFVKDFAFRAEDVPTDRFFKIVEEPFKIMIAEQEGNGLFHFIKRHQLSGLVFEQLWQQN